jgi:LacI family transcriptional regulator
MCAQVWRVAVHKRVTIYDVAAKAGVSISTVSQALNRPARVTQALRERVFAAVEELGYVPAAEAVLRGRTKTARIGVVGPFTAYNSYMRRLAGVLEVLHPLGEEVCVFDHESATVASPLLASIPLSRRLDALIVMGLSMQPNVVNRTIKQQLPVVMVDFPTRSFTSVVTDDVQGGRLAAEHLLEQGYRSFLHLIETGDPDVELSGDRRLHGFLQALSDAGCAREDVAFAAADHSIAAAEARMTEVLAKGPRPRAVFCHDDTLAVGALRAARSLGLGVPADLAVMGFDDGDLAAAADLSTVRQPFEESGRVAARALLQHMDDPAQSPQVIQLPLQLVRRDST